MKKFTRVALCALAVCAMATGLLLAGCAQSEPAEDVIRSGITGTLDQVKNLDDATIEAAVQENEDSLSYLSDYGVDAKDYIKGIFNGFDYSIGDINVDESAGTATAEVTITAKTVSGATNKAYELAQAWVEDVNSSTANMTEEEVNAKIGELVMQAIDETEAGDKTVTLHFTKSDNTWSPDSDILQSVEKAMY